MECIFPGRDCIFPGRPRLHGYSESGNYGQFEVEQAGNLNETESINRDSAGAQNSRLPQEGDSPHEHIATANPRSMPDADHGPSETMNRP